MLLQKITIATITSLGLSLGVATSSTVAQIHAPTSQFQRIEQPLWVKGTVTAAGLGLIGLELWWFLGSKPK